MAEHITWALNLISRTIKNRKKVLALIALSRTPMITALSLKSNDILVM